MRLPLPKRLTATLACALLLSCGPEINAHVPADEEKMLNTDGVIARYHSLLNTPHSHVLSQQGYLIGIEKAGSEAIGYPLKERPDTKRLRAPQAVGGVPDLINLRDQQDTFYRAFNDPKLMFVSHIIGYRPVPGGNGIGAHLDYAAYSRTAFGPNPKPGIRTSAYEEGWKALHALETKLKDDIDAAKEAGKPFSHILLLSMGWNNDQQEAVQRYNALVQTTRAASGNGAFNPLVIGLTWPSVWGGTSALDLLNRGLHIGSYPVKAVDADEIGFGIANHLLNVTLPKVEAYSKLRTVVVGHSMGARIMTRAYYSADQIKDRVKRTGAGPIVISLQAAFSANRFKAGYQLAPPFRYVFSGEGSPYQDHDAPGGHMLLTWSTWDKANPIARFATGARHVGGKSGYKVMTSEELADKVHAFAWSESNGAANLDACAKAREVGKLAYANTSGIIREHGDIRNPEVGKLVWTAMTCFGAVKQ